MKIGLVRHFKVKYTLPKKLLVTTHEVIQWFDDYETEEIEYGEVDLRGVIWTKCFASPLPRAAKTAATLFTGKVTTAHQLKELNILPSINKKLRLPFWAWIILIRTKSMISNDITNEFKKRIGAFVDELLSENDSDVLIVSHGFVMLFLQKELISRGFRGDNFKAPANGKLYVFEK